MSLESDRIEAPADQQQPHRPTSRKPPGYRVLHVLVPERVFNRVKAQAFLSGMRFPAYVAKLLEEAEPYPEPVPPTNGRSDQPP